MQLATTETAAMRTATRSHEAANNGSIIGYACEVTCKFYAAPNNRVYKKLTTNVYFVEGKTPADARRNAAAECRKQETIDGTVACVISSDAVPVTRPTRSATKRHDNSNYRNWRS